MKSLRKQGIDLLLSEHNSDDTIFGDLIASILFREGEMALLVDTEQKCCRLFYNSKCEAKDCFLRLTDILGTVISLEDKGLVYISDASHDDGLELFFESKEDFYEAQIPGEYYVCDDKKLVLTESIQAIIGEDTMKGSVLPAKMYYSLVHVFCGTIYPTKGLKEYVGRGYRTSEEENSRRSRFIAWVAIIVSIIIGLVSIWLK